MFVSEKIVFLELHKTGCTHIRTLLSEVVGGKLVGKHNQADPRLFAGDRLFLGSVRDPWDWYVSLWAYGCDGKGSVRASVVKGGLKIAGLGWRSHPGRALRGLFATPPRRNPDKWRRVYRDVDDPGAFREWLQMMHDSAFWSDFGEGYGQSPSRHAAGLFTYRYLNLFCTDGSVGGRPLPSSNEAIVAFERDNCFIDCFIRNENLESDLFTALERAGVGMEQESKARIQRRSRTNTSSRKRSSAFYYDAEAERLVAARENLIIRKFGYVAPSERSTAETDLAVAV